MKMMILVASFILMVQVQQALACGDETNHPTKAVFCKRSAGEDGVVIQIDACIAPIVEALQKAGVYTLTSCCGHGKEDGYILLEKGGLTVWKEKTGEAALHRYKKTYQPMSDKWDAFHQSFKRPADKAQKE